MLSYAGVQMFMQKLNHLIHSNDVPSINHPEIIHERPQFQLLYDELHNPLIQSLFIHQHQYQNKKFIDLKKRFIDAVEEAEFIVDLFLSGVHNRTTSEDFNPCLNVDDVSSSIESVDKVKLMSMKIDNMALDNLLPTPDDGRRSSFKYVFSLFLSCLHIMNNNTTPNPPPSIGYFPTPDDDNHSLNLDDVWRSLESFKVELTSMNITDSSPTPETILNQSAARNPQGSRNVMDGTFVGLDDDLELIRDKLVEDQKKLDIVSIVGMGGIGKTTLATKLFNDPFIMYHFHVRVWATVSQTYDKRGVLIQILESIRGQLHLEKDNSEPRLREMVHRNLMGKRYLIVIDDIWHTDTWDNLKLFFPHDKNGSRILLTTRLMEVAKHANSDGLIHPVGCLSKERSWELLCKKVFRANECPKWSIKPGMEIVENCKGLPLAVVVIAGVLAKEALSEKFWVDIAERTGSYICGDQNGCLETLGLSYSHLPLHLRDCFLYFGGFPEDYEFKVIFLIWLWVAEGFIEEDGNRSLEDIAEGYLMDLIDRNLVIITHRSRSNGAVKACKVHDLVRELCLKKGNEEGLHNQFYNDINMPPYKPTTRIFINKDVYIRESPYPSANNFRAILCFSRSLSDDIARCFCSFVLLRVLDLRSCSLNNIPKGMELLVHLRYLAIFKTSAGFPSSICNLWNLQTLIYTTIDANVTLPSNISDLVNLRHLWTNRESLFILPSIDKPMSLQTVTHVELGDGVHNLQKCFPYIKELTCDNTNLKMKEHGFKSLTYLEKLKLRGCVYNHITFPTALRKLTLEYCFLQWSHMSTIQSLPSLQVLQLIACSLEGSCWNTDGQEFAQLKVLRLWELDIQQWKAYSTTFPCLRQLQIMWCRDLEEIPLEIGEIPTLELIQIKGCRHCVGESVRRIQEEQHDFGNYNLKIEVDDDFSDEE